MDIKYAINVKGLKKWRPAQIISGGQIGVDRAALDAGLAAGIPIGGYCPKGRRAENGMIPERYPLVEMETASYRKRTEHNVVVSDGTLIIVDSLESLTGGSLLTLRCAEQHGKPSYILNIEMPNLAAVHRWGHQHQVRVVNVAGPSEKRLKGKIYEQAYSLLLQLFQPEVRDEGSAYDKL